MENLSYMKGYIKKSRFKIKIIDCFIIDNNTYWDIWMGV